MAQNAAGPCSLFRGQAMGSGTAETQNSPKFPEKHDWEEDEKQSVLKSQVCK